MLDIYKLQTQYLSLRERTRALRHSKPSVSAGEAEGYELQAHANDSTHPTTTPSSGVKMIKENEAQVALRSEWRTWQLASLKNVYVSSPSGARYRRCADAFQGVWAFDDTLGGWAVMDQPADHWCAGVRVGRRQACRSMGQDRVSRQNV